MPRPAPAHRCTSAWSRSRPIPASSSPTFRSRAARRRTPPCSAGTRRCRRNSTGWKPLVDGGQLRLLAIWTADRSKNWPDAPTLKELGYPFVFDSPFGIAGPKGMDPTIVAKLHDAFKKAIEEKAVIDMMAKYDMVPRYLDTAAYRKAVEGFIVTEKAALEKIGLAKKE